MDRMDADLHLFKYYLSHGERSPTEDFKLGWGLRQDDHLSPFLFLIAAKGLFGLMRKSGRVN